MAITPGDAHFNPDVAALGLIQFAGPGKLNHLVDQRVLRNITFKKITGNGPPVQNYKPVGDRINIVDVMADKDERESPIVGSSRIIRSASK